MSGTKNAHLHIIERGAAVGTKRRKPKSHQCQPKKGEASDHTVEQPTLNTVRFAGMDLARIEMTIQLMLDAARVQSMDDVDRIRTRHINDAKLPWEGNASCAAYAKITEEADRANDTSHAIWWNIALTQDPQGWPSARAYLVAHDAVLTAMRHGARFHTSDVETAIRRAVVGGDLSEAMELAILLDAEDSVTVVFRATLRRGDEETAKRAAELLRIELSRDHLLRIGRAMLRRQRDIPAITKFVRSHELRELYRDVRDLLVAAAPRVSICEIGTWTAPNAELTLSVPELRRLFAVYRDANDIASTLEIARMFAMRSLRYRKTKLFAVQQWARDRYIAMGNIAEALQADADTLTLDELWQLLVMHPDHPKKVELQRLLAERIDEARSV